MMEYYNKLDTLVLDAKNDGAVYGRQLSEGERTAPDNNKLKNIISRYASKFANTFHSFINTEYKELQTMESQIALERSNLDNRVKELCIAKQEKKSEQDFLVQRIENHKLRIAELEENLQSDVEEKKKLEAHYLDAKTEGDLKRIPMWIFIAIMSIVGIAEMFIYQGVFFSQEIGITAEMEEDEVSHLKAMAYVMGTGFIIMITWLSHEAGKRIRHIEGTDPSNRTAQWLKVIGILLIVIAAIFSTVKMRSDMHKVSELNTKLTLLVDAEENDGGLDDYEDDSDEEEDSDEEDEDFDEEDESDEEDEEFDDEEASANSTLSPKAKLEKEIIEIKAVGAWYFMAINFFIFIGGVMLAYHTHTSSVRYESLESLISRKRKKQEALQIEKIELLDHLKNDKYSAKGKKSENELRENDKVAYYEELFMQTLKKYLDLINTYDAHTEELHSKANATRNSFIDAVKSYVDAITDYKSIEFDHGLLEDDMLTAMINDRTKMNKYLDLRQDNGTELLHIDNINEFIASIDCTTDEMTGYFNTFKKAEAFQKVHIENTEEQDNPTGDIK